VSELYNKLKLEGQSDMFAILDKPKPDIVTITGFNLAAVKHVTVQVNRLPL
jgi:hypothetical protein